MFDGELALAQQQVENARTALVKARIGAENAEEKLDRYTGRAVKLCLNGKIAHPRGEGKAVVDAEENIRIAEVALAQAQANLAATTSKVTAGQQRQLRTKYMLLTGRLDRALLAAATANMAVHLAYTAATAAHGQVPGIVQLAWPELLPEGHPGISASRLAQWRRYAGFDE